MPDGLGELVIGCESRCRVALCRYGGAIDTDFVRAIPSQREAG